jgi:hypothetical protein
VNGCISLRSRVVVSPRQVSCAVGEETVILSLADGVYYGLDPVGSRIWSEVQTLRRVRDVRDTLLAEYDVDSLRCEHDLLTLLTRLAEHDLLEVERESSGQ